MSPAGSGAVRYIPKPHKRLAWAVLASAGLLSIVLLMSGGSAAHASTRAPSPPYRRRGNEFQADCVAGPSPGQGSAPEASVCWERNLKAVKEPTELLGSSCDSAVGCGLICHRGGSRQARQRGSGWSPPPEPASPLGRPLEASRKAG